MRLAELSAALFDDIMRKARRRALAGIIVAICAVGLLVEATSAGRLALEPTVGPVGARLIVAAAFAVIAAVAVGVLVLVEQRSARAAARARAARGEEDPRAALIAEAVSVGYSIGRDFMKASPNGRADASPPSGDSGFADEKRPAD